MAGQAAPASLLLLSLLIMLALVVTGSYATGNITTYWGQYNTEGGLEDACLTGRYNIINIAFLNVFGNYQKPVVNLTAHCNASVGGCTYLEDEIKACQNLGIKVMLSLGGPSGKYCLESKDDANNVATYLWDHFLGGESTNVRPFGGAILDGIDFYIDEDVACSNDYWDALVGFLAEYSEVLLSAAPRCNYPDPVLDEALNTGLFDYVWIRFYNATCQYNSSNPHSVENITSTFIVWTSNVNASSFFLGLTADPTADGYIECDVASDIIADIHLYKYGGVMIWNRYYDGLTEYSDCFWDGANLKRGGRSYSTTSISKTFKAALEWL